MTLILGISKKVIFASFLFINFIQPSKSSDFFKINSSKNIRTSKLTWLKPIDSKTQIKPFKYNFDRNFSNEYSSELIAETSQKQKEIVIQSDKQSEVDNVIYAEGNVSLTYKGKILKADSVIYDKSIKKISAKGNIAFIAKDQIFKASQLEFSFIDEKGYLLDVEGFINTNTLMDDLSSNFSLSDTNQLESLFQLKKKKVFHTPGKVENWLFFTDKINIDGKKWKSKKAVFSNDLLELKQVKLVINSLEVISEEEKLQFKSSLNYLIFEGQVSIPFWLGNVTLSKNGGYDYIIDASVGLLYYKPKFDLTDDVLHELRKLDSNK